MRRGFGMLMTMFFIIALMSVALVSLNFSTTSQKQVTQSYISEQAEILAQSATEYTILRLLKHDFNASCLERINTSFTPPNTTSKLYDIDISVKFIDSIGKCRGLSPTSQSLKNSSVIVDVAVTYNKSQDEAQIYPVRFFKRTLQKL